MFRHQRLKMAARRLADRGLCFCLLAVVVCSVSACRPPAPSQWKLLGSDLAHAWKRSGIAGEGSFTILRGDIRLEPGQPMTGARFDAWQTYKLPVTRYAIDYDAMRVAGNDFFGTVTFPVNETHVSLIIGGWGGTLVGISSIDDMDASENNTRGNAYFKNNVWYKVRIEVRDEDLRVWIDSKLFVNTSLKGHKLGLRPGDIEKCVPFGFATYETEARIRGVTVSKL